MTKNRPLPNLSDDYPIWNNVSFHKNFIDRTDPEGFRRRRLERTQTIVRFLQDNRLASRRLLPEAGGSIEFFDSFILRWGDLTAEGKEFYCRAEQKWLAGQDRGKSTSDASILERELKKLRSENRVSE